MNNKLFKLLIITILSIGASCNKKSEVIPQSDINPQNIILLIGDGMGAAQVQAAMLVSANALNLEKCIVLGQSKTSCANNYITDSAAGATAMACGEKTNRGYVGVDTNGNPLQSILHFAEDAGLATGLIATLEITHATPASFIAHQPSRKNFEDIALDFMDTDIDLFIGGGLRHFNARDDGLNLIDTLIKNDYAIAFSEEEIEEVSSGKLVGLVSGPPSILDGRGDFLLNSSIKALDILSQNKNGFFLMIEGSQIDWGGHANNIEYVVTEVLDFDKAIGAAIDFADTNGNTLVIVTADHETGGLTIVNENILTDSLAVHFSTDYHTSTMVPVYAYGVGAEKFVGIYENTAIFEKMMDALDLNPD